MTNQTQPIVRQAVSHFKNGDFQRAKACYQQAAREYGDHLFANSIRLCELRMGMPAANVALASASAISDSHPAGNQTGTARQLEETQKLLEHYYTRCQELEYQVMDHG